jgi:hypothetical protein
MERVMAVGIVTIGLIYTTPKLPSVEDRHTTVSSRRYHHRPHPTGRRRPHHRRTQCQLWPRRPSVAHAGSTRLGTTTPRWSPSAQVGFLHADRT